MTFDEAVSQATSARTAGLPVQDAVATFVGRGFPVSYIFRAIARTYMVTLEELTKICEDKYGTLDVFEKTLE